MAELLEKGSLVVGGPFLDNSGGMAASPVAADKLAGSDPSVEAGLLEYTVRPWLMAMADPSHSNGK